MMSLALAVLRQSTIGPLDAVGQSKVWAKRAANLRGVFWMAHGPRLLPDMAATRLKRPGVPFEKGIYKKLRVEQIFAVYSVATYIYYVCICSNVANCCCDERLKTFKIILNFLPTKSLLMQKIWIKNHPINYNFIFPKNKF